jgi:predicted esterase
MTAPDSLPLVHEHRPGDVSSDAPAVVLLHGRGTNERDLLPIQWNQLPIERDLLPIERDLLHIGARPPTESACWPWIARRWGGSSDRRGPNAPPTASTHAGTGAVANLHAEVSSSGTRR